jgi:hypothetical protein
MRTLRTLSRLIPSFLASGFILFMSTFAQADIYDSLVNIIFGRQSPTAFHQLGHASGFIVSASGVVVTAKHAFDGQPLQDKEFVIKGATGSIDNLNFYRLYTYRVHGIGDDLDVTFYNFLRKLVKSGSL